MNNQPTMTTNHPSLALPPSGQSPARVYVSLTAKVLVSIVLLALLLRAMEIRHVTQVLVQADRQYLLMGFVMNAIAIPPMVFRWQVLARALGLPATFGRLLALHLISGFFSNFLPTSIGGDIVRAYGLGRGSGQTVGATMSVLADRLLGLVALGLVALTGLSVGRSLPHSITLLVAVAAVTLAPLLLFRVSLSSSARRAVSGCRRRWLPARAGEWLRQAADAADAYGRRPGVLALALLVSLGAQGLLIVSAWLFCRAVDPSVPLGKVAAFVPLITLLTVLPVSINGLGVQDGGFVLLFGRTGTSAAAAVSMSLLWHAARAASNLLGGLLYLRSELRRTPVQPWICGRNGDLAISPPTMSAGDSDTTTWGEQE